MQTPWDWCTTPHLIQPEIVLTKENAKLTHCFNNMIFELVELL